jgi:capsule polysaccharide modification protein KpsS
MPISSPPGAQITTKPKLDSLGELRTPDGGVSATSKTKKILIVQGDWEAGMSLLAQDLRDAGHEVHKVVLCAPDFIYRLRGIQTHVFRKPLANFDAWLRELVSKENFDTFFLYNHYRPYNGVAWDLAEELDLGCYVFELGLIRPNCVTVFCRKSLPLTKLAQKWDEILAGEYSPKMVKLPQELCKVTTPAKLVRFSASFLLSRYTSFLFPNFVDQRELKLWHHVKYGLVFLWRFMERGRDTEFHPIFAGELSGKYYTVPLQVHSDTQIIRCSDFDSIEEFIMKVVDSFERHAPADTKLVFKVHPMDRGYKDYRDLLHGLDQRLGGGRILYVDRVSLPILLNHSLGLVNINSSVGISGLTHHIPVIALGTAVYDLEDLTYQGDLDSFWTQAKPPCKKRVNQFIHLLLQTNQSRGTLSQRCFDVPGRCKIKWVKPFQDEFFGQVTNQ